MRSPKFLLNGYQLSLTLKPYLSLIIAGLLITSLSGWAEDSAPTSTSPKSGITKKIKQFFSTLDIEWMPEAQPLPDSAFNKGCTQLITPDVLKAGSTYKQELFEQLLPKWNFLAQYSGSKPVFSLKIAKNGEIIETRLLKSSGFSTIDTQAMNGLNQLLLPAFPTNYPLPTMQSILSYQTLLFITDPILSAENKKLYESMDETARPWLDKVTKIIQTKYWRIPSGEFSNKRIKVLVQLDPQTGQVFKRSIILTSCNPKMDESILKAIDKASPFPPFPMKKFPPSLPKDILTIMLDFKYKV